MRAIALLLLFACTAWCGDQLGTGPMPVTSAAPSGAAAGDLGGTYPNPTVVSVADVTTGTLPVANGGSGASLAATGGANQFVRQSSVGGAFTVSALAAGDLPNHSGALITSGLVASTVGGTGVNNAGTLTNASNTTITGGGTVALGGFTLTVPATGTAAELGVANAFTAANTFGTSTTPVTITQGAASSGSPTGLTFTGGAHTTLTTGTEDIDVNFNLARTVQFATTVPSTQRAFVIQAPTYACDSVSQTIGSAATLVITAAPVAGTNVTITSGYALWVQAGLALFTGGIQTSGSSTFGGTNCVTITQGAVSAAVRTTLAVTPVAATTVTTGTENPQVKFNFARTQQWATTTPATQREFLIDKPTYSCNAVSQTITTAATVDIIGAPVAGTNVTITNGDALRIEGGMLEMVGTAGNSLRITTATANAAVAVTFGSVGPTGSTAGNAQGWLLINVAGTNRYIPFW